MTDYQWMWQSDRASVPRGRKIIVLYVFLIKKYPRVILPVVADNCAYVSRGRTLSKSGYTFYLSFRVSTRSWLPLMITLRARHCFVVDLPPSIHPPPQIPRCDKSFTAIREADSVTLFFLRTGWSEILADEQEKTIRHSVSQSVGRI